MIIPSTNDIKGYKITRYLGLINTNVVIGTNYFSDFFATISDVFGGYSDTYQSKLDEIYREALLKLTQKAEYQRADAIVGVHFDFDELSGKGKSMFMVTAYGTAVIAEAIVEKKDNTERYNVYQKLYNLSIFKEKGIITEDQYDTEKNNLLLNHEKEIEKEIENIKADNNHREAVKQAEILSKQREEERQKLEKAELEKKKKTGFNIQTAYEAFMAEVPTIIIMVRKLLKSF